jgi:hypothetical protein
VRAPFFWDCYCFCYCHFLSPHRPAGLGYRQTVPPVAVKTPGHRIKEMPVDVQSEGYGSMAHLLREVFQVLTSLNPYARIAVSERMKTCLAQSRLVQGGMKTRFIMLSCCVIFPSGEGNMRLWGLGGHRSSKGRVRSRIRSAKAKGASIDFHFCPELSRYHAGFSRGKKATQCHEVKLFRRLR